MNVTLIRRLGIFVLFLVGTLSGACIEGPETGVAAQAVNTPTVSTDQSNYATNQPITVSWTGMPGNPMDWVSINVAGSAPDNGFVGYAFINGVTDGSHAFAGLADGTYEARAYGDNTYTILATSAFTVGGVVTTATVSTDKAVYSSGQPVTVSWAGMPGNAQDWVAIVQAGSPPDSGFIAYAFINSQVSGSQVFTGIPAGSYEARAYNDNTYVVLASSMFSVTGAMVSTDMSTYAANQAINISWSGLSGIPTEYVSINTAGSAANAGFQQQFSTNSQTSGTQAFTGLPVGSYEARAYLNDFTVLATATFVVTSATVSTDAASYPIGGTITITFAGLPGNPNDWISIAPEGSSDTTASAFAFTGGATSGTMQFSGFGVGTYEARAYVNNTYTVIARSAIFAVAPTTSCGAGGTAPVLSSVTSGDITLDPTLAEASAPISAPLAKSILFTSVRESEPSPNYGGVMCALDVSGVTCDRNNAGTDSGNGTVIVHWTVVTFSSGVTVQRGLSNLGFNNPIDAALTPVDPTKSFVVLNGMFNGGSGWGNNEFVRAQLTDGQTLDLRTAVAGTQVPWQVVEMSAAVVQRGSAAFASADMQQTASITTVPPGSFVLASYTTDNTTGVEAATMMMETKFADTSTVSFTRDMGGSALAVSWEVVSLPYATYTGLATFAAGEDTKTASIAGLSPSTSVALGTTQSLLGASTGSTTYAGAALDLVGEAAATMTTAAGSVSVQRTSTQSSAEIPWTVIDFAHDCNGL